MLAITGGTLLSPGLEPRPGSVLLDDAAIVAVGERVEIPAGPEVIDARGGYVAPGFLDVHVHGGAGADFLGATPAAVRTVCRFHASGGTTGLLATTAAAPTDELLRALDVIKDVQREVTAG